MVTFPDMIGGSISCPYDVLWQPLLTPFVQVCQRAVEHDTKICIVIKLIMNDSKVLKTIERFIFYFKDYHVIASLNFCSISRFYHI